MTYTTALIMEWLSSILWPLARVSSLLMVMAVFGINGFVIGPAIAAMFFAVWHIEVATRSGVPSGTPGSDASPTVAPPGAPVEPTESGPPR